MPFVKKSYDKLEDYILDIQQDLVIPWSAVHDEIDFVVDYKLITALMKKVSNIAHCKSFLDKVSPLPFINFVFDIEYDDTGSWTARKALETSTSIAGSHIELKFKKEFLECLKNYKNVSNEVDVPKETIELSENEDYKDFVLDKETAMLFMEAYLNELPEGNTIVRLDLGGKKVVFRKKVDLSKFLSLYNK